MLSDGGGGDDVWVQMGRETSPGFSLPSDVAGPWASSSAVVFHARLCREQTLFLASASSSPLRLPPFSICQSHFFLEGESSPEDRSIVRYRKPVEAAALARWLQWTETPPTTTMGGSPCMVGTGAVGGGGQGVQDQQKHRGWS